MADGISYAPEHILKLVMCGCSSERPCKCGNCSCMGHQLVCTMFCGSGSTCANPFSTKTNVTDVTNNSDTESDDDNHDHALTMIMTSFVRRH